MMATKYRTCNLCEALCGLAIEVEDGKVTSIKGDKEDTFSRGHICPKAVALKDLHEDPDRLKRPLEKVDGEWHEISWEDAINKTAKRLYEVQQANSKNAVAVYQGNPSVHNLGTSLFSPGFVRALGTKNRYSATSVDQLGHHLAGEYMLGHQFLVPVPDINRTDFWLILGGNPMVSNGSLMTAPDVGSRLKAIQKRGGKVVVIDPRRTETADKADQHLFVRPGTDIWLILAMLKIVLDEDLMEMKHLADHTHAAQITEIKDLLADITVVNAARMTGISEEEIRKLTHEFCAAPSAVCYGRLGVSAAHHGGLCHWAINLLNIITGNFDRPGGAMLTSPAVDLSLSRSSKKRFRRWKSRVRGLPEFGGELPSSTIAEDILAPGDGQIKAMVTSCGNPVLSVPNGRRLDEAFASLDFMVSIDIYLNETTRHADIILPPATGLETPHYGMGFHNLAIHNSAKFSEAVMPIEDGMLYDWQIFSKLQRAFEKLSKSEEELSPQFNLEQMLEMTLQMSGSGMTLSTLKEHPHGIDLGPLQSTMPDRLKTADKKIDLIPDIYKEAIPDLLTEELNEDQLLLIGRRHLRSNNSWLHNSYRMVKGRPRCTMLIHPDDAAKRDISNGDRVAVTSNVGTEYIAAEISDEMMKGSVSIPHGWGHTRKGIRMNIAAEHAGTSMNDLVDDMVVDKLSGVSVINAIPVEVALANENAVAS